MTTKTRTKSEIEEDLRRLREWLNKQPHFPKNIGELFHRLMKLYKTYDC